MAFGPFLVSPLETQNDFRTKRVSAKLKRLVVHFVERIFQRRQVE